MIINLDNFLFVNFNICFCWVRTQSVPTQEIKFGKNLTNCENNNDVIVVDNDQDLNFTD